MKKTFSKSVNTSTIFWIFRKKGKGHRHERTFVSRDRATISVS